MQRNLPLIVLLFALGLPPIGCGHTLTGWTEVSTNDPRLGHPLPVDGDPECPDSSALFPQWKTAVVVRNVGPAASVGYRDFNQVVKIASDVTIHEGGLVALRVCKERFEILFFSAASHPAPALVERLPLHELRTKYPDESKVPLL